MQDSKTSTINYLVLRLYRFGFLTGFAMVSA